MNLTHRTAIGSAAALASAAFFALNVTLVPLVYAAGGNIHFVTASRSLAFGLCLFTSLVLAGRPFLLPRSAGWVVGLPGVLLGAQIYCLLGAVELIPVGLAILLMYLYPSILAVHATVTGTATLGARRVTAIAVAFAGLALVLNVGPALLPAGIALGVLSAVIFAAMMIASARAMARYDDRLVMMYVMVTVALLAVVAGSVGEGLRAPATPQGWIAFAASTVCFIGGTFLLFTAVRLVGPLRTGVIDNTAPLWAMLYGFVLLDQSLTAMQYAGAGAVVAAVAWLQVDFGRDRRGE